MFHRYINYKCAIFNSYVKSPEGKYNRFLSFFCLNKSIGELTTWDGIKLTGHWSDQLPFWGDRQQRGFTMIYLLCISIVYGNPKNLGQESKWNRWIMFFLSVLAWRRRWFHIYGYPLPIRMGLKHQNPPELVVSEALDGGRCDCVYQPYHRPARIHFRRLATKHGVGRARNRWVCYGLLWLEPCWHLFSWMTVKSRTWQSDLFCPAKTEIIRDHCQGFPKFNKDLISLDPQPPRPFMMKHGVIYR